MLRRFVLAVLVTATISCGGLRTCNGQAIPPQRTIQLTVPNTRGRFAPILYPGMAARDHFAMHLAPDQSILVFDADATGNWPLVRVRQWWTDHPSQQTLNIPAWSTADARYLDGISIDLQTTPDGRYALAFSRAVWKQNSSFLLHVPKSYIARKPDTIITVIDLQKWLIVKSIHTDALVGASPNEARVLNNLWLAFDASTDEPHSQHGAYTYANQLLSIPDLKAGPSCTSERLSHLWRPASPDILQSTSERNDHLCRDLLAAAGLSSTQAFEARIRRDSDVEPGTLKLRDVEYKERYFARESKTPRTQGQQLWDADQEEDSFFRWWGDYPYYQVFAQNPPLESSAHMWYGLYGTGNHGLYELGRFNSQGEQELARVAGDLLCGDPAIGNPKSACGCRVIDVSEQTRALLAYCRQQRGDFAGMVQKQWLSAFHSDDLTAAGLISLPKDSSTLQALALQQDQPFVITLQFGELLNVYPIAPKP